MNKIRLTACMIAGLCLASATMVKAQTFTVIADLPPSLAYLTQLVQGNDGNLLGNNQAFGTTGKIVQTSLSGQTSSAYTFCSQANCADGTFPEGTFQAADGTIYGTTQDGGANSKGTVFELSDGKETVLYSFCSQPSCTDGWNPYGAPAPSVRGGLVGATFGGGAAGKGVLYQVSSTGEFTALYSFCALTNCTDGSGPVATPFQTANGTIYGTTNQGGQHGTGSVFAFTPSGRLITIYSFPKSEFAAETTLIQGADGNFYGITLGGGASGDGSFFKITPQGQFTSLYSFCPANANCTNGDGPTSLLQGSDGNFYGTTLLGGTGDNGGTIFEVTPQGNLTTLYSFCQQTACSDGEAPQSFMQDTNGLLYGTTENGGSFHRGIFFSLSTGLAAFVRANPGFGKVGVTVGIQGSNLTGTTSVTFNGVSAAFEVVSPTYIKAQVPSGATTGSLVVTTPSGTLNSNVPFTVLP